MTLIKSLKAVFHRETAEETRKRIRADLELMAKRGQLNHALWQANHITQHHDRFNVV